MAVDRSYGPPAGPLRPGSAHAASDADLLAYVEQQRAAKLESLALDIMAMADEGDRKRRLERLEAKHPGIKDRLRDFARAARLRSAPTKD